MFILHFLWKSGLRGCSICKAFKLMFFYSELGYFGVYVAHETYSGEVVTFAKLFASGSQICCSFFALVMKIRG